MKKILLLCLIGTLALTACDKKETAPSETNTSQNAQETTSPSTPDNATSATASTSQVHDHTHHDHAGHDHHHEGDLYQCGDKTVHIVVHDHDGEIEAHLTSDNITYDLNEDIQTKGRFTTDDGISGEDKGMVLLLDGNKAKVTTPDDKVLLNCTKK